MAHCEEYLDLISAAIDGALSPAQRDSLEAHLEQCPECRALYGELSALHADFGELPPIEPPEGLTERIMEAVAAEKVIPLPPQKSPVRWQRWLASAAVLALVLLGTWSWKPWLRSGLKSSAPLSTEAGSSEAAAADAAVPEAASDLSGSSPTLDTAGAESAAPKIADSAPGQLARGAATDPEAPTPEENKEAAADDPGAQPASPEGSQEAPPAPQQNSQEAPSSPQESAQAPDQAPVAPRMALAAVPAPESDGGIAPAQAPTLFSSTTEDAPTPQPAQTGSSLDAEPPTPQDALERLSEICPMPENGTLVDTEDRLGWETPLVPVGEDPSPNAQQVSTRLEYLGLSANGKYHEFWLHSFLLDDPAQGLAHSSTLNFFAVPLDGGEILEAYGEYEDLSDPAAWEAYQAGFTAYQEAISN